MDREYGYEEDYKSNIEVKANEILEGYELAAPSHNKMNIGGYRLSKQLYQETVAEYKLRGISTFE